MHESGPAEPGGNIQNAANTREHEAGRPREVRDSDLESLRGLLFSREIALLESLENRLDDPRIHAREVGEVLAEAILLRGSKDERLAKALEPAIEGILHKSLRKNPMDLAGLLFPLMGPAIRRSISETFRAMLEGLSKTLEMSFSWKGLRWRLEALRSGKSFSEVVLLHTLVYRVEQVFLIHAETGLVLGHAVNDGADSRDADMVSAMLTAIQDFVRDCFTGGGGDLDSIRLGEFNIYMEKSPQAFLACVVRGTPPADFRSRIQANFDLMLVECSDAMAAFNGDTAPFFGLQRRLDDCLSARFVTENKPLPLLWGKILPAVLAVVLAAGLGWWIHERSLAAQASVMKNLLLDSQKAVTQGYLHGGIEVLRREPGLMPTLISSVGEKPWPVLVLRDDFARAPEEALAESGFNPEDFAIRVIPYVSYEPDMVARRVRDKINPPPAVSLAFADGVLSLSGSAPADWIANARQEALALPGVKSVDVSALRDPRFKELDRLVAAVESVKVEFPLGGDAPVPSDAPILAGAVDRLVALERLARLMGISASVTIYGYADALGTPKRNYEISQARARTLAAMLYAKGSSMPVFTYGMGADYASNEKPRAQGEQSDRRVELRVRLVRAVDAAAGATHK